MKRFSTSLNAILIGAFAFIFLSAGNPNFSARAAASAPTPAAETQSDCSHERAINVSGVAVVNVVPDRVLIQLGVQSNAATVKNVQAANNKAITGVMKALKALGIDAKDIATDFYYVQPIYEDYDSLTIKGYRAYNMISVTLREVEKTSAVIAVSLEAGANQVINVEFYTSELRKYRDQAREMAMKAAAEKAGALASAVGAKTNCVLTITENTWSSYNGGSFWGYGSNNNLWSQNAVQNAAPTGSEGMSNLEEPVTAGQISIRAEVQVAFGLK